jgi:hypothetical protein
MKLWGSLGSGSLGISPGVPRVLRIRRYGGMARLTCSETIVIVLGVLQAVMAFAACERFGQKE